MTRPKKISKASERGKRTPIPGPVSGAGLREATFVVAPLGFIFMLLYMFAQ